MKLVQHTVTMKTWNEPVTIIPFGCLHADDPGFREDLWAQCVKEIMATPGALAIGMGDYKNWVRGTARKHLKSYTADEDSWKELDRMVRGEVERFTFKWLKPMAKAGKLLGLSEGNHYHQFVDSTTDTQYMCQLLEVPYLDKPAFVRLNVKRADGKTAKVFKILLHHGDWSGGYTRIGGDINSAEMKALGFDFDVYLYGHTHRLWGLHMPSLTIPSRGRLEVVERPRAFMRCGSFVAGYTEGCPNYVQKKLLPPTHVGYGRIYIHFYREYNSAKYKHKVDKSKGNTYGPYKHRYEVKY